MSVHYGHGVDTIWWSDDNAALHEVSDVYWGENRVYTAWETVKLTGTTDNESQAQFHQALADRGYDYTTIKQLPFNLDTSEATELRALFYQCWELEAVPAMDTSQVTNMRGLYQDCYELISIPVLDTRKVTNIHGMFWGCHKLVDIPDMETPFLDSMHAVFYDCESLVQPPELIANGVTNTEFAFHNTPSVETVRLPGLTITIDLQDTALTPAGADAFMQGIGGPAAAGSQELLLPESAVGCNPVTAEDKGWLFVDLPGTVYNYTSYPGSAYYYVNRPVWATHLDYVVIGGGGGGASGGWLAGNGQGGSYGEATAGTANPGSAEGDTSQIRIGVGQGGSGGTGNSNESGASAGASVLSHRLFEGSWWGWSALGGDGGSGTGTITGSGVGLIQAHNRDFGGSSDVTGYGQDGNPPGGGGAGGDTGGLIGGGGNPGGSGADGQVWFRLRGGA